MSEIQAFGVFIRALGVYVALRAAQQLWFLFASDLVRALSLSFARYRCDYGVSPGCKYDSAARLDCSIRVTGKILADPLPEEAA